MNKFSESFLGSLFVLLVILADLAGPAANAQESTNLIFTVSKTRTYYQSNSLPPVPDCELPYCFLATAQADELLVALSGAKALAPNGSTVYMSATAVTIGTNVFTNLFRAFDCTLDQESLDEEYPSGVYDATLDFNFFGVLPDTAHVDIPLTRDLYANTPRFLNPEAAQRIPANGNFTFNLEPFANAGDLDAAGLFIFECTNSVSACANCAGNLAFFAEVPATNPAPSVVVPAGTLRPGVVYEAQLVFDHWNAYRFTNYTIFELFDITLVARSSYTKLTRMPIRAVNTVEPPQLTIESTAGTSPFRLRFNAETGGVYRIQASTDLQQWTAVHTTNATAPVVNYSTPWSASDPPRFFRVIHP